MHDLAGAAERCSLLTRQSPCFDPMPAQHHPLTAMGHHAQAATVCGDAGWAQAASAWHCQARPGEGPG